MFAVYHNQSFVPQINQGPYFCLQLLFGQLGAVDMLVFRPIPAVSAIVYTIIADIQGRKGDDAAPVHFVFDLQAGTIHLFPQFLILTVEQDSGLIQFQAIQFQGFGHYLPDPHRVGMLVDCQQVFNQAVIDKIASFIEERLILLRFDHIISPFGNSG